MAPIKPHWKQPSHPDRLELVINEAEYNSKSLSMASLAPFAVFAKLSFPPCTPASTATYATVQTGRDSHLQLNSDLLYINHSCEPSLIFDTGNMNILTGANGLKPGDELTFFYPSTEWDMAQPFDCTCGKATCRGRISGARDMKPEQLDGLWLNNHIRDLLDERSRSVGSYTSTAIDDATVAALKDAVTHAQKVVEAAKLALQRYTDPSGHAHRNGSGFPGGLKDTNGLKRRGATSRELSGEMGGDTITV